MEQSAAGKSVLSDREQHLLAYLRDRINCLLSLTGTGPMPPQAIETETILESDPIGVVCESVALAIEQLQLTNSHLTSAHEEMQAILSTADVGILVVDSSMRVQAFNPKFREQLREHGGHLIGKSCCQVLCGLETPPERCTFQRIFETNAPFLRRNWPHNNRFYDVSGAPVKDRNGDISRVVLIYQDVTDRRRTEDILIGSEEMYRQLFELSDDLVFHLAPDGAFMHVNPAGSLTLGRAADDFAKLSIEEIVHPSLRDETVRQLRFVSEAPVSLRLSTVLLSRNGTSVPVSGVVSSSFADDRHIITCGIFRRVHPAS